MYDLFDIFTLRKSFAYNIFDPESEFKSVLVGWVDVK